MGGGTLISIVANERNIPDLYLTGDPQITMFKVLFRRSTPFSMQDSIINIKGNIRFGDEGYATILPHADMLHTLSLVVDIPTPEIDFKDPIYRTVRDILIPCGLEQIIDQIAMANGDTLDDLVTYEKLFGPDITNPVGPLADAMENLVDDTDIIYSKRLDVLNMFKTDYKKVDNRFSGRYVAIKPELIDFTQFEGTIDDPYGPSVKPINPSGYLIMKASNTEAMYNEFISTSPPGIFSYDLTCMDFLYDARTREEYLAGESIEITGLQESAIPVMENLVRVYPRQIPEYRPIRTVEDYVNYLGEPNKNHSLIISISQIDRCRKILLELAARDARSMNVELIDLYNRYELDECILGSILLQELLDDQYEFGVYSFEPDFNPDDIVVVPRSLTSGIRSTPDYDTCVADLFRQAKIRIPIVSVDRDVTAVVSQKFNRYCSNENAIYNKTYDLREPLRTPKILEDVNGDPYLIDTEGYWLLDVSLIDRLEQSNPDIDIGDGDIEGIAFGAQDVIMITPDTEDTDILINPFYLDGRSDRLDWATYVIERTWPEQIFKREIVDSTTGEIVEDDQIDSGNTNTDQVAIFIKPENILDGVDILSNMVCEMYGIQDVELASDIAQILNNDLFNVDDIEAYHKFLEAIRNDLLNTENQLSSYRLNSASGCDGSNIYDEYDPDASKKQTLFNSRDLREIMTGKMLRDIIYVDQVRFGKDFADKFNYYTKSTTSIIGFGMPFSPQWMLNIYYDDMGIPLNIYNGRETARNVYKYAMWSYHLENIEIQSRASETADQFPSRTMIAPTTPYDFYEIVTRYFNLFYLNTEKRYYVWFDTNGDGITNDSGPFVGALSLPVDISGIADPNNVSAIALALQGALDGVTDFTSTVSGNVVTVESIDLGNSSDIMDNNTAFTFSVVQQGSDSVPEISAIDTTTNVVLPANYYTSTVRMFDIYYFNPVRYYVWLDPIGDMTLDPGPPVPGAIPIWVDISSIKLPDDRSIAEAIQGAIDTQADFTATVCENSVLISPSMTGNAIDISDFNTEYAFNVKRQGSSTTIPQITEEWAVDVTSGTTTQVIGATDYLSKMLIQVPVEIDINGNIDDPVEAYSHYKNVRFGKDDIDQITDSEVYEDSSIIERFQTDVVAYNQLALDYFQRDFILSGVRFNSDDTINDQIEDVNDLTGNRVKNPLFVDGRGTAINREVELYHVIRSIDHNSSDNISRLIDSTIKQYFIDVIADAYQDSRALDINYINTISYGAVVKYLNEFFANVMVLNSELSVEQIGDVLLDICQNAVITTQNNFNRYIYYIWRNSSYVDEELDPREFVDNIDIPISIKTEVSFCQPGDKEFMELCYPDRFEANYTCNPLLMRAKHLAGIDVRYRPRMGYGFTFDLDLNDPETYRTEKSTVLEEREFTADQAGEGETTKIQTPSILGSSDFKDDYSVYIDNQVNRVKNHMKDLISFGPSNQTELITADTLRENLVYTDWFDIQNFQTRAVDKIAIDRELCPADFSYYTNAYVINHLPMTLAYYYGLYGQKIYTSIYPALETGDTNLIENLELEQITSIMADIDDELITPITNATIVATGSTVDSVLQFIGTDIRPDAQCPIHGAISNLTSIQKKLFDDFIRDNATLGDTGNPIYDECPLCFRTYAMNQLFDQLLSTVLTSESKISETDVRTLENEFTDDEYIRNIIRGTTDQENRDGLFKNIFLFRPEIVYLDRVTETFFDTAIQYFLIRFATIQYRYARMVRHSVERIDFAAYVLSLTPTPDSIFGVSNLSTYADYVAHLTMLQTDNTGAVFEAEYDLYNKAIMHEPSDELVQILKNQVRVMESTTQYIDYVRGEETIYPYSPARVIQNIVYNGDILTSNTYNSVRYMLYRGNVAIWYTIQRTIIDLYNEYLNNLSDPREIETTNDLFIENYNILQSIIPDQYTSISPSNRRIIDFYRFKQVIEAGQEFEIIDTSATPYILEQHDMSGEAVDMISYAREQAIYYRMLVVRYEKRRFALSIIDVALDDNTYYFEKTDTIVRKLMDSIRQKIENFDKAEIVLSNIQDRECFFFNDTSNLYYLDSTKFRTSVDRESDPSLVEDVKNFDYMNNYHLAQAFTYNQIRNFYRLLGLVEADEIKAISNTLPSILVPQILIDLELSFTDDYAKYRSLDQNELPIEILNNTSKYTQQELYITTLEYLYQSIVKTYPNRGLFYDMWSNYPTVSTILYDLDFDPVTYDEPDPMGMPGVYKRYITGVKSSSPLNILKNRLEQFDFNDPTCGAFHTPYLKEWEAKYICAKPDTFDALRRVFNVYYFLTGACDYQDIYSNIGFARLEIATGDKSLTARFQEFEAIADDIVKSLARGFTITNNQFRIQNQLTTLLLLHNRHEPSVNAIKAKHLTSFNCIRDRVNLIADQFEFYMRCLSEMEITTLLDDIYNLIDDIDSAIASVTIDDMLAGIQTGIVNGTITTLEELEILVESNLDDLESAVQMAIFELDSKLLIIQEQSCLKFTFIRSSESELITDQRVHTPIRLFNLKELQLMNNFKYIEDVVRFLIAGVVAYMTPTTDRITPIYLDGIVTDAEKVVIDAESKKNQLNSRYNLPSIFDGGFNPILAEIIGDANPFRAGNYFSTSLCEAMRTLFPQIDIIYSETKSYQSMVDDLIRSIQLKLDIMMKLTVLDRYKDLTKLPVCGFYYYDFDRVILPGELGMSTSLARDKRYINHKKDVRSFIHKKKRQKTSAIVQHNIKSIYRQSEETGLVDARQLLPEKKRKLIVNNKTGSLRQTVQDDMNQMNGGMGIPLFFGSEVYERILKVLRVTDAKPKHAWVRQLGFRMIEELALMIDGEEIDGFNDELLLLLRKMMVDTEHDRGMDIMVGHIPEMYEISDKERPALRLYIPTWFAFSRFPGCSLPLINMIHSNALLRVKLRNIEDLLYIEPGAELKKPVKIHVNFMGRYIFLEEEERRRIATTKIQTIMERYRRVATIKTITDITSSNIADGGKGRAMSNTTSGQTGNVTGSSARVERLIKQRYYFEDPTKFLMFRMRLIYPNARPEDKIYWDIAGGSAGENERLGLTDQNGKLIQSLKIFDRVKLRMNSVTRDNWRQEEYFRRYTTYNRNVRTLDMNEGIYSFALFLKGLGPQPNGATNMTMIDNLTFFYEMSDDLVKALAAGARVKISMFQCSHNVFLSVSGFGALGFYGTHYS